VNAAVFFDRDGTLNEEVGHLVRLDMLRVLDGAPAAVKLARDSGFRTAIVTNQSGIARGLVSEELVDEANRRVAAACGGVDAVYYCPHHPDAGDGPLKRVCECRKPAPGMILRGRDELGVELDRSVTIGDSLADLGAAARAGCGAILVRTGKGARAHATAVERGMRIDHVADDVLAAVRWFVSRSPPGAA